MGTPLKNTFATWKALFLKTTLDRLFGKRMAWAWLIIDPAIQVGVFGLIRAMMRNALVNGVDMFAWMVTGMLSFFVFRRTSALCLHSIDSNRAFFAFRQVRPFDAVFMAAIVEAFIMVFVFSIILGTMAFFGVPIIPYDPLILLVGLLPLFVIGLAYGMIGSVIQRLAQEAGHIFQLFIMPLYFVSGAILPLTTIPPQYREYLLLNPLVHCIETVRLGFFENYYTLQGVDIYYSLFWALSLFTLAMVLYRAYETELVAL